MTIPNMIDQQLNDETRLVKLWKVLKGSDLRLKLSSFKSFKRGEVHGVWVSQGGYAWDT